MENNKIMVDAQLFNILLDLFGSKKAQVFKYIINHLNNDNQLIMTTRELSLASNVSHNTVITTLKDLENANLITHKTGCIILNEWEEVQLEWQRLNI